MWTHRLMLESALREDNAFVTLTYSEDSSPRLADCGTPILRKRDAQLWLKRLRKSIYPATVRFYLVGEYGDETARPHYHAALFGYKSCLFGRSRYALSKNCCVQCDRIRDTWKHGLVDLGELNINSAQYLAGYVTKKMTAADDKRLLGRPPEFALMSKKPGLGADFMHEVGSELLKHGLDERLVDVPTGLRHGRRVLPLGRYLRRRLRKVIGRDEATPQSELEKSKEEMRPLFKAAFDASRSAKKVIVEDGVQRRRNFVGRNMKRRNGI